jgi:hypothetical protein
MALELSPFVLQKIRERKAQKDGEPEEEPEEPEEAEDEDEAEEEAEEEHKEGFFAGLPRTGPKQRQQALERGLTEPRKSHHAIGEQRSHRARSSSGSSLTDRASKFFKNLGPAQTVLLVGGGLLVANHLMVPRGTSVLSQILNAIAPAPKKTTRRYYAGLRAPVPGPPPLDPNGCGPDTMWDSGKQACVPILPWPIQQASGEFTGANWGAPGGPSPDAHADSWGW